MLNVRQEVIVHESRNVNARGEGRAVKVGVGVTWVEDVSRQEVLVGQSSVGLPGSTEGIHIHRCSTSSSGNRHIVRRQPNRHSEDIKTKSSHVQSKTRYRKMKSQFRRRGQPRGIRIQERTKQSSLVRIQPKMRRIDEDHEARANQGRKTPVKEVYQARERGNSKKKPPGQRRKEGGVQKERIRGWFGMEESVGRGVGRRM
ncbi:hypothetical protein CAEBREN_14840 [Caenorhabditis brenneri]|uniref:Uncharacterized protein n=1 Tax=Caenorhabditis brenneri TaxID=135651 RepID=G0MLE6_CAEBE|nr:hypothetical protein CAEBREN_14840 [Caenorhabditis brenneri]